MNRMLAGPEDWGQPGFPSAGKPEGLHAFAGARRHSRRVRVLRVGVPVMLGVMLIGVVLANYLNPLRFLNRLPTDFGTLVISGSKITMEAPRLVGFTRDQRGYEVTAKAAAQDLKNPTVVELKEISARIDMQDKSSVSMTALDGHYDTKSELLTLGQQIFLSTTTGYEGRLSEALVDIKKGSIVSEKPVQLKMQQGTLNANRLEVTETGTVVRFDGGVVMTITAEAMNRGMPQTQPQADAQ